MQVKTRQQQLTKEENDMRKLFFLLCLAAVTVLGSQAVTVQNTAGQLSQLVQDTQITQLTVRGTMDARDFLFITNELTELTSIDLSQVTIVELNSSGMLYGTATSYRANEIPRTAFFGKKLTTLTLPSNIESIGFAAFAGCYQLRSVTLPASLTAIDDYAFAGSALTTVNVPSTVQMMGKGVFARCESLTTATIDAAYVGNFTFHGDTHLSQVNIGPALKNISKGMFNGCIALTSINLDPACRMTRIDDEAFINSGLQEIDLNGLGVGTIGEWALAQTKLSSVELGDGMTKLGEGALAHNPQLLSVILPGMGHNNGGGNRAPHRPHTIADISDYTFADDGLLDAGELLREGVATIGNYALYNVSADIDTMRLPSTLTYLGDMAMAGMTGMKVLKTAAADVPALGNDVWAGVNQPSVPLIAPDSESSQLYQAADQWKNFFFQNEEEYLVGDVNGDGNVNINDVTALIRILLTNGEYDINTADVNGDGRVTIGDVTDLINMLLSGNSGRSVKATHDQAAGQFSLTSDALVLPAFSMKPGDIRTIDVELENAEHDYTALQCEVILPQGLKLTSVKGIDRGAEHTFFMRANDVEQNVVTIMGAAMNLHTFAGKEGNVMRLTLIASEDFTAQNAELTLTNVVLVTAVNDAFLAEDATSRITDESGIENINADKQIASIRYVNVAGQEKDQPFDGVNIVVTTYTDGTYTTTKVIK